MTVYLRVVLSLCFIGSGEYVTFEVFMLCDFTMFSIFSFLIAFIVSLDECDQVSTAICKDNIHSATRSHVSRTRPSVHVAYARFVSVSCTYTSFYISPTAYKRMKTNVSRVNTVSHACKHWRTRMVTR